MNEIYQKTLSKQVNFEGVALHSGNYTKISVLPGKEGTGIIFKRTDIANNNLIVANYKNVTSARLCTTLENKNGVKVSTVEHLLAAFYIAGIDNAIIEIDSDEVPIMDGSSKSFLDKLKTIDLISQNKKRKYLKILNKVELVDGKRTISIEPNQSSLEVDFQLNYNNKVIGNQKNLVNFQKDNLDQISSSRTFCLFEDIEKIKKLGLAKGGSLDNAVVIKDEQILNENGLRNKKEFVNHKILDLSGDFFLSGFRILGKVNCFQGGHQLSNIFLRKLFNNKSSFKVIQLDEILVPNKNIVFKPVKAAVNA